MVPKGWNALNLKNVAKKIQDGNYGADYPKADELVASGIPFLTSKVIGGNGKVNQDKFDYISEEKHQKLKKAQIRSGDILFTNRGANVGTIAITPDYLSVGNIGPQLTLIRCNEKIEKDFLFQFLRGSFFQKQVRKQDSGSAMNFFGIKDTERFKILVPPLPEQRKIAAILSTWDKAITTTEQLLANSQQQKKALMQQLLTGKKRLLDENGERFRGEWAWLRASELFKPVSVKNNSEFEELLAVTQDKGVLPRSLLERRVVMPDGTTQGYKLVVPGNFIISLRSFQGGLEYSNYRGLVSPAYTVLEQTKEIEDGFYKQYYKSYNFIGHLAVAVIGIRDGKQISYDDFSFLKLPYPTLREQQKIASVLNAADEEISALQQKIEALKQEKKALMQQLLTGKRRVKVDEVAA